LLDRRRSGADRFFSIRFDLAKAPVKSDRSNILKLAVRSAFAKFDEVH